MRCALHPAVLVPPGLIIDHVRIDGDRLIILAHARATSAPCPSCGLPSARLHSRYTRALSDLPISGRRVLIRVVVRRFRCAEAPCRTRIVAERFEGRLAARHARRT